MFTERTSVGLDVHARSIVAAAIDGQTHELFQARLTPSYEHVRSWLEGLPGPVAVAYEAGPTGFGLYRYLGEAGIRCEVVAPSKLQRPAGDRVKTDAKDAIHLARLMRLDEIVSVTIPSVDQEAARDLVRAREDCRGDLMRARHRLSKLLLRHGQVYCGGNAWTGKHDMWLRNEALVALPDGAARLAFDSAYDTVPITERDDVLDAIADGLEAKIPELTTLGVVEVGVPVTVSAMTQQMIIGLFRKVADEARKVELVEERPRDDGGISRVVREPSGVVAAIIPWNGPLGTIAFKLAPALAAGCSVVLKTSPEAPLSPLVFADVIADLVEQGRIPAGVVSVVAADRDASEALVTDPRVDHITFTGSTATGRRIMSLAGDRVARVSLELGGKSAAIVLDDADLNTVMASLTMGGCMQSGQACIALTRVLVSEKRHDEILAAYQATLDMIPFGDPWQETTFLGPLSSAHHRDRVADYIEIARSEGATVVRGGGNGGFDKGFFIEPTLVDGVRNDMRIAQEEVFGPVISFITYKDEDDAVAIANDSVYGLSGAVFTSDEQPGFEIAQRIQTGTVNVNTSVTDFSLPFGGYKQSGLGREGGPEGLEEFFQIKTVHFPAPAPQG